MGRGITCNIVGEPLRYFKRKNPTGAEGAEGPGCGARGRRRARLRCPWAAGPCCGARGRRQHRPQPNFARNLTRSFFEMPQKRCNSNDANSTFEQTTGELRATLLGNHPGISNGRTSQPTGRARKPHPRHNEAATGFPATASLLRSAGGSTAPPARRIRRSCPRDPRPRRGQPRGGRRGRGTGSRTRSPGPHCGRSGSTAGRHRARHTRRA